MTMDRCVYVHPCVRIRVRAQFKFDLTDLDTFDIFDIFD